MAETGYKVSMGARRVREQAAIEGIRVPPHSVEAEQAVLGGLMLDNRAFDAIADRLTANDFYRRDHQLIYEGIAELAARGEPYDAVTLSDWLERKGHGEEAGGLAYLASLVRDTPSAANVRAYADAVRERSTLRQLIHVGGEIAASAYDPEGREAGEILDEAERRVFQIAENRNKAGSGFVALRDELGSLIDRLDSLNAASGALTGVSTGFSKLDEMTAGLQRGDLIVIAGRPSMGKTTFALNIAENAAFGPPQAKVGVFSMEMSREQLAFRMISSLGRVDQSHLRTGQFGDDEWSRINTAIQMMKTSSIYIDDTGALTPTEVRARARRLKREHGLDLIVLDYLQLMQVAGNRENRATEISEISRSLKALAKELSIPVIALSQLNRSVEQRTDKRPVMSDLRECVTGDSRVWLTDGRRVPIRELVGQTPKVWSVDKDHKIVAAQSDKVWHVGQRPVFCVRLASGRSIRATAEHRLLAGQGWTTVAKLAKGDRLALSRRVPAPVQPQRWPEHWLVLLGHLVGDGSYLKRQPLRYTTASEENSAVVRAAAEQFGCRVTRHAGRGAWHQLVISGNGNRWAPAGVGAWLKELGLFDQRSHEKTLPPMVFALSDDQIALLLRHLWATDGSVSLRKPGQRGASRVYFSTCSAMLANDVAALLLRLGIVARIRSVHSASSHTVYTVDVSGAEDQRNFAQSVGGFGPRAGPVRELRERLAAVNSNTNVDTLPMEAFGAVRARMREQGVTTRAMAGLRGTSYGGSSHFRFAPSRQMLAEYAQLLNAPELTQWVQSELFWDRVIAIEPDGQEDVYDLTVPGPANWLADGIVTHNSGAIEQDADVIMMIYRDEVYDANTTRKGIADIIITKQRNGPIGDVQLTFLGKYTKFENYAPESAYGDAPFG
jgi:replicative DNA helicase